MTINDNSTIREIQAEFSKMFPGLKIEFYRSKHDEFGGSKLSDQLHPDQIIKDIRKVDTEGDITIYPDMTVLVLENLFEEKFGLNAQVFRKSKDIWLQTSVTDHWTLEIQNRKGIHSMQI